jgi:hypothetical protein
MRTRQRTPAMDWHAIATGFAVAVPVWTLLALLCWLLWPYR